MQSNSLWGFYPRIFEILKAFVTRYKITEHSSCDVRALSTTSVSLFRNARPQA